MYACDSVYAMHKKSTEYTKWQQSYFLQIYIQKSKCVF